MTPSRFASDERLAIGTFGFAAALAVTANVLRAFDVAYVPVRYGLEIGATAACCIVIVVIFVRHHIEKKAFLITLVAIACLAMAKALDVRTVEVLGMQLTGLSRDVFAHVVTTSFRVTGVGFFLLSLVLFVITSSCHAREAADRGRRLAESEGRLRAVVETAADGIVTIDERGTIASVNRSAAQIFGYREDELVGRNVTLLMSSTDRERHDGFVEAYLRTGVKKIIGVGREVVGQRKDGSRFPLELAVSETKLQDRPTFTGIVRDITERRQAEEALRESEARFRQLAENIQDVFYLSTAAPYRTLYVSPAFETMWQRPCALLLKEPRAWSEQVHPDDRERVLAAFEDARTLDREVSVEYRIVRPDGSMLWIRDRGFPIRNADGQVYRRAGVASDITDLKQAEAALRQSNEELARTNQRLAREMAERSRAEERARQHQNELAHVARLSTMGEMAAGLAHELNQPLAAIRNYTGACERMLRSGVTDATRLLDGMTRASVECDRAANIIRRLRAFIRRRQPHPSAFDVNRLVSDVAEFMEHDLRQSDAALRLELDEALPEVFGDTIQIEQVILNLVRNAIEAMADTPEDRRQLTMRTAPAASQSVEVSVSDAGCGLPAEGSDRLFDLFVTTKPDGLGLGLGISRSIIEAHRGRLWATSNGEGGTTFQFTLPVANPVEAAAGTNG